MPYNYQKFAAQTLKGSKISTGVEHAGETPGTQHRFRLRQECLEPRLLEVPVARQCLSQALVSHCNE